MTDVEVRDLLQSTWPGWQLKKLLGAGSYGRVYEIEKEDMGATFSAALKVICIPNENSTNGTYASSLSQQDASLYYDSVVESLMKEYLIMSQLKGITNIVSYEEHTRIPRKDGIGWVIFIRMELLKPLSSVIYERGLSRQGLIRLGIDLCRALEICKESKIIHRDIKPENIFVSKFGNYKLGDFGVAKTLESTQGLLSKQGTAMYMAPEIYSNKPYDESVDIYSLGLVMYQYMNHSRAPFVGDQLTYKTQMESMNRRMSGEELPVPAAEDGPLAQIVLKACSPVPGNRYESPADMRSALESLVDPKDEKIYLPPKGTDLLSMPTPPMEDLIRVHTSGKNGKGLDDKSHINAGEEVLPSGSVREKTEVLPSGSEAETKKVTEKEYRNEPPASPQSEKKDEAERSRKRGKNTPAAVKIGGAVAAAVVVLIAVVSLLGGDKTTVPGEGVNGVGGNAIVEYGGIGAETGLKWSEWAGALPAGVTSKKSVIEVKLQYRSVPLGRVSGNEEIPEGATLFETAYGEYGEWSGWRDGSAVGDESTEVELQTISRYTPASQWSQTKPQGSNIEKREISYNNRTTTVTEYRRKASYNYVTQYRSRTRQAVKYYYQGTEWSDFSDNLVEQAEDILVNYRMQYRYAPVETGQVLEPSMGNFPVFSGNYAGRFRDVDDNAWYGANQSGILRTVNELGILLPDEYMRFSPEKNATVGQIIRAGVMINRIYNGYTGLLGENNGNYQIYSDYAIEQGIIRKGEFSDLTKEATRQEMAYILYNSLPEDIFVAKKEIDMISDMDMGYRYYDCALAMAEAGIINLKENNEYRPEETATRAEVASIIDKLIYPEHRS